jgi:dipeptidyl aminopeptidase/acylaminoacyl peptidase
VVDAETAAYAPGGQLLFVRQRKMFAQSFDPVRLELAGNPYSVDEPIYSDRCQAAISTSSTGSLLYRSGPLVGRRHFVWFDRSGEEVGTVGEAHNENPQGLSMSPDGRYIALSRTVNGIQSLWLIETVRGILNRLSVTSAQYSFPVWSPDGRRIAFNSSPNRVLDLYQVPIDGSAGEELLLATALPKGPNDWSPDGRFLLYRSPDPKTGFDIWALPVDGNKKPFPVVQTNFDERDAQFSPDGKWIAFESNESGQYEIYVQAFPGKGGKTRVSRAGGAQVRWRRDGSELFYIGLDDRLMAVAIRLEDRAVQTGDPVPLFSTRVGGALQPRFRQQYVVSQDGQRFLMNSYAEEPVSTMRLILNWKPKAQ